MSEFHPNRVSVRRPRFTLRRALNFWPLIIWVIVLGMAFWAYNKGVKFTRMNGLIDPIQEAVAADEDSRILKILVKTGTPVKQGDPLVELDTGIIDAQIQKYEAAIRADLEDRILSHGLDLARLKSEQRRILRDKASDEGELSALNDQMERYNAAIAQNPSLGRGGPLTEIIDEIRKDVSRLTGVTAVYPEQIEETQKDIDLLSGEIEKLKKGLDNPESLASANGDLSTLTELRELKKRSTLYSNHDGFVAKVERDDGEFVLKGETIVRVVASPEHIRVLLLNDQLGRVKVGDKVWVSAIYDRYKYFETVVTDMSPRIINGPNTTSPLPNQVIHGQEIIAKYPMESGFIPGQPVIVHIEEPGKVPLLTRLFGGQGRAEQH